MNSIDRGYRLWFEPSIAQSWQPSRSFDKLYGRYQVEDWYYKHEYHDYPGVESYYYVNLTGWHYPFNLDGSRVQQKRPEYFPLNSFAWKAWSDNFPWDKLPDIPGRCIENISRPVPWFRRELERRERQRVERIGQEYEEWCANDVFYQGWNDPDYWYQHSEWNVPNVDEDAMSRSVSKTSVRFEGDTSGRGSSTDQLPRDKLPEKKAPKKRKRSSAAKYTSVECKPCHKKTEKSGKEPEERNKKQRRKRQKKSESNQAEVQESPRANKMEANKRKFEEQESRRDPKKRSLETRNIRNRDCSRRSLRKQAGEVLRIYQIRSGRPTMKVKSSRLQ